MSDDADTPGRMGLEQVTRRLYDPAGDVALVTEIVYALADARNVSPTDLTSPTLYECVDVESLEATLFDGKEGPSSRRGSGTVTFQYADYVVTVWSDGWIEVSESSTTETEAESDRS